MMMMIVKGEDLEAVERVGVEIAKTAKFRPEHRHAIPEFDPLSSAWPWTFTTDEHMHELPLRVPILEQDETGVQLDHWHPIKRREETESAQPFVRWYGR